MIGSILAVIEYEVRRSLTLPRMALWLILAATAPGLIMVGMVVGSSRIPIEVAAPLGYALIPQVCCMLGLLLWATPAIQSEMEDQTWIFVTLRPNGRTAILLGKYVVAVLWTLSATLVASLAFSLLATEAWLRLLATLSGLAILSCLGYGALYLLIGTLFTKRSTIVAFAYSLVIEFAVSFIPATVNELTISYRLRSLMLRWADIDLTGQGNLGIVAESQSTFVLVIGVLGMAIAFLVAAVLSIRAREIPMQSE